MIDEIFEKDGIVRPTGNITINNLRVRKEAVRAGVGITVLPNFAVREEVRNKTLKVLAIEGDRLLNTQLMIVEARRRSPNANVELVKKALEKELQLGAVTTDLLLTHLAAPDLLRIPLLGLSLLFSSDHTFHAAHISEQQTI
jgi:DNA-binding transcriptional LysR family regulator